MLSQELNNHAASLIEQGQFDEAISSLAKGMRLSRDAIPESDENWCCSCCNCSLDACIKYSTIKPRSKPEKEVYQTAAGHIHRQPIAMNPKCLQFRHSVGPSLPLLLTFNLALAHHLKGLNEKQHTDGRERLLSKAKRFYELSYRIYEEQLDYVEQGSLWFEMMLSNNLGQLYQSMSNEKKHTECMEDLMTSIMFFVDCREQVVDPLAFDGFIMNASNVLLHPSRCAAAA